MNKTEKVREHLKKHKNITSWDAIQLYRATRLSAIIFNLRNQGWNIISIPCENDDGERWVKYVLEEE